MQMQRSADAAMYVLRWWHHAELLRFNQDHLCWLYFGATYLNRLVSP